MHTFRLLNQIGKETFTYQICYFSKANTKPAVFMYLFLILFLQTSDIRYGNTPTKSILYHVHFCGRSCSYSNITRVAYGKRPDLIYRVNIPKSRQWENENITWRLLISTCYCNLAPRDHFTQDFSTAIQIRWKFHVSIIPFQWMISLPRQHSCRVMCKHF